MDNLIHPKETGYKTLMYVISGIIWIPLIFVAFFAFFFSIPFIIISWISSLYFKAQILGDSVKVTNTQYPEIYNKVNEYCRQTNINDIPEVFIYNSNGLLNAFAVKIFMKKFVMLTSSIVDISYKKEHIDELNFIIGHELGHHAAGHTSIVKNIFIAPAKFVPFLGAAYSRACELTADRYGMFLNNNIDASVNSLVNLAHGSRVLSHKTNIDAFISQENEIPELMGFISKIYSTHPRLTRRVIELKNFAFNNNITLNDNQEINTFTAQQIITPVMAVSSQSVNTNDYSTKKCNKCGHNCNTDDSFCENCGNKLK